MTLAGALADLALPVLRLLDAERAHELGLRLAPRAPRQEVPRRGRLATRLCGLDLDHPLGLAAGFDKNGVALRGWGRTGFAFAEAGTVTLRPQPGNPRPRVFRLQADRAIVNRLGFNNEGAAALAERLARGAGGAGLVVGANIGLNKDSATPEADYTQAFRLVAPHAAYVTVNVSSPNTPGLRALQAQAALEPLLRAVVMERDRLTAEDGRRVPLLLKLAPDLDEAPLLGAVDAALASGVDGLVLTNTTLSRPSSLRSPEAAEAGGLSGPPVRGLALQALERAAKHTRGRLDLIACGGITTSRDALERILRGACALQVYTAFAYRGPELIPELLRGLNELLAERGFASVADAKGAAL